MHPEKKGKRFSAANVNFATTLRLKREAVSRWQSQLWSDKFASRSFTCSDKIEMFAASKEEQTLSFDGGSRVCSRKTYSKRVVSKARGTIVATKLSLSLQNCLLVLQINAKVKLQQQSSRLQSQTDLQLVANVHFAARNILQLQGSKFGSDHP